MFVSHVLIWYFFVFFYRCSNCHLLHFLFLLVLFFLLILLVLLLFFLSGLFLLLLFHLGSFSLTRHTRRRRCGGQHQRAPPPGHAPRPPPAPGFRLWGSRWSRRRLRRGSHHHRHDHRSAGVHSGDERVHAAGQCRSSAHSGSIGRAQLHFLVCYSLIPTWVTATLFSKCHPQNLNTMCRKSLLVIL